MYLLTLKYLVLYQTPHFLPAFDLLIKLKTPANRLIQYLPIYLEISAILSSLVSFPISPGEATSSSSNTLSDGAKTVAASIVLNSAVNPTSSIAFSIFLKFPKLVATSIKSPGVSIGGLADNKTVSIS